MNLINGLLYWKEGTTYAIIAYVRPSWQFRIAPTACYLVSSCNSQDAISIYSVSQWRLAYRRFDQLMHRTTLVLPLNFIVFLQQVKISGKWIQSTYTGSYLEECIEAQPCTYCSAHKRMDSIPCLHFYDTNTVAEDANLISIDIRAMLKCTCEICHSGCHVVSSADSKFTDLTNRSAFEIRLWQWHSLFCYQSQLFVIGRRERFPLQMGFPPAIICHALNL